MKSDDDCLSLAVLARLDTSDLDGFFSRCTQHRQRLLDVFLSHDDTHADAAIEHPVHFTLGHITGALQPLEQFRTLPRRLIDHCLHVGRQYARQ